MQMPVYQREPLIDSIRTTFQSGKTPYIVTSVFNNEQIVVDLAAEFSEYALVSKWSEVINLAHQNLDAQGLIFSGFSDIYWPLLIHFSTFASLLTNYSYHQLTTQGSFEQGCIPVGPRMIIGTAGPEVALNDWMMLYKKHMNADAEQEFKNVGKDILSKLNVVYVGGLGDKSRWFRDWLDGIEIPTFTYPVEEEESD